MKEIAVITGGSSGIGEAAASKLVERGIEVFVIDIKTPQSKEVNFIYCDVCDVNAIEKSIKSISFQRGRIDYLVLSAGIHHSATIEQTTLEDYERVVSTNLKGCFFTLKHIIPIMKAQKSGSVVIVGSDQSFVGKKNSSVYGLTKAAIAHLAKSTALDYAKYNVRVNCVCPGTIDTPLYRNAIEKYAKKTNTPLSDIEMAEAKEQPIGRVGTAVDVANLISFLCSDQSIFMTGSLLPIDGGYIAQ